MAYSLKYYSVFESDEGNVFRIEILEKDYVGTSIQRRLGGSPLLKRDNGEARINGLSLEFLLEAEVDGEFISLYTTDNKKYKVIEYFNNIPIFYGYLLPERYSENYIAAPYDVSIAATDGLGILKGIDFKNYGKKTILEHLKYCLDFTGNNLEFHIISKLISTIQDTSNDMLFEHSVWGDIWKDKSCYDVISAIMYSINAVICQHNSAWLIVRENDLNKGSLIKYNNNLIKIGTSNYSPVTIGSKNSTLLPNGYLDMIVEPGKNAITITHEHAKPLSAFKNADCEKNIDWNYTTNTQTPSEGFDMRLQRYVERFYYMMPPRLDHVFQTFNNISQSVDLVQDDYTDFELTVKYKFIITELIATKTINVEVKITNNTTTYYLTETGWITDQYSINVSVDATPAVVDKSKFEKFDIIFSKIPITGTLTITITNQSSIPPNPGGVGYPRLYIGSVYLTPYTEKGRKIKAIMSSASEEAKDIEISFIDGFVNNTDKLFYSHISKGNTLTTKWKIGASAEDNFIRTICRDYAGMVGYTRRKLVGSCFHNTSNYPIAYAYLDSISNTLMHLRSFTYDQITENVEIELIESVINPPQIKMGQVVTSESDITGLSMLSFVMNFSATYASMAVTSTDRRTIYINTASIVNNSTIFYKNEAYIADPADEGYYYINSKWYKQGFNGSFFGIVDQDNAIPGQYPQGDPGNIETSVESIFYNGYDSNSQNGADDLVNNGNYWDGYLYKQTKHDLRDNSYTYKMFSDDACLIEAAQGYYSVGDMLVGVTRRIAVGSNGALIYDNNIL